MPMSETRPATPSIRPAELLALMRPRQWTKNAVCLAGVFFSVSAGEPTALRAALLVTMAFCLISSCIYILNDFIDREEDRDHPVKRHRPLAMGSVSLRSAALLAALLAVGTLAILWFLPPTVTAVVAAYLLLNLAYSGGGKRVVILDVLMIAAGFVLRILAGTEACGVEASSWILACGFSLALFLGFAKRRAERAATGRMSRRAVLKDYSLSLLDRLCLVTATLTLCSYFLFAVLAHEGRGLLVTCPPVVFGTLRYLFLLEKRGCGEAPEIVLLQDRPIQLAIVVWAGLFGWVLYGG
jgi:4-hydroxybenzoate polyprenyltransferase